jgi:hypothetical protein
MNWIKKNPAQFALAVIAVLLLGWAFMVISSVGEFSSKVVAKPMPPAKRNDQPKPNVATIDESLGLLSRPALWQTSAEKGSLFVSKQYVRNLDLIQMPKGQYFNLPVPNDWLEEYKLDYTTPATLDGDPDSDGFSTLLEWNGMDGISHLSPQPPGGTAAMGANGQPLPKDSTSPQDPKLHPPYHTRLQAANIVSIPFRLTFKSYDLDRQKKIETVAVNAMDAGARTFFGKLGETIPNTTYKLEKFDFKEIEAGDGTKKDVSELTVVNTASGNAVVLPLNQVINSPESYMVLRYLWVQPGGQPTADMNLRKGATFKLPPENDKEYKIVDIKPLTQSAQGQVLSGDVTVALPGGQTLVLKFPAPK